MQQLQVGVIRYPEVVVAVLVVQGHFEIGQIQAKIVAVVEDVAASGGYYIAAATDQIFVNKSSLVGSIGVVYNGFGFVDLLKQIGELQILI